MAPPAAPASTQSPETGWLANLRDRLAGPRQTPTTQGDIELFTHSATLRLTPKRNGGFTVAEEAPNPLGQLPVVHIQNVAQPFAYDGLSEVEPLIALQDELNTRLSDRAHRVTLQSFKMYLAKGIDGFGDRPVAPGQMWSTDNPDASIQAFGGDAHSPSEDAHIAEVREALDKASGISPLVTGVIRDRLGHLSSENALRIVTMGLITRTDKKRDAYGRGIRQLAALALHAADLNGTFRTAPDERRLRLDWPDPMPLGESDRLRNARLKLELGVPRRQVLAELGYSAADLAPDTTNPTDEPAPAVA
ncbi:MAG: phage portal protein [Planctomycetota bacterium]